MSRLGPFTYLRGIDRIDPRALLEGGGRTARRLLTRLPSGTYELMRQVRQATRPRPRLLESGVRVRRIENAEEFEARAGAWDALARAQRSPVPFLLHSWLAAWWRELGAAPNTALRVLEVEERGRLLGFLPLYVETTPLGVRVARMLGDQRVGSEYLDLLAQPGREAEVAAQLADHLLTSEDLDGACLLDLADGAFVRALTARPERMVGLERRETVLPYVELWGSVEAFYAQRSRNMRYNLRRKEKKLFAEHPAAEVSLCTDPAQLEGALEQFFALHQRRWVARGQSGNLGDEAVRAFHRRAAPALLAQGVLRLYQLSFSPQAAPAATLYSLRFGGREFYLQAGMDPAETAVAPGFCLMKHVVEDAAEAGLREFEMLRGTEGYKSHWASGAHRTISLTFARPTARGLAWIAFRRADASVRATLKETLPEPVLDLLRDLSLQYASRSAAAGDRPDQEHAHVPEEVRDQRCD